MRNPKTSRKSSAMLLSFHITRLMSDSDETVRFWLRDIGSVLELQVYRACIEAGCFDDIARTYLERLLHKVEVERAILFFKHEVEVLAHGCDRAGVAEYADGFDSLRA